MLIGYHRLTVARDEDNIQSVASIALILGGDYLRHAISLCLTMVAIWLLFSGYYTVFILSLGAISVIVTVYIVLRMETLDQESHPVHLTWSVFSYIPWLILEIIKANLDVAKRVISGGSSIDPAVLEVKSTQKTELGQVIFLQIRLH